MPLINFQPQNMILNPLGRIEKLLQNPCDQDPNIYVEAATLAALRVLMTIVYPNPKVLIRAASGTSWVKIVRQISQIAVEIAPEFAGGGKYIFPAIEAAEAGAYWFWIASLGVDFGLQWLSAVYELSHCNHDTDLTHAGNNPFGVVSANGDLQDLMAFRETFPTHQGLPCSASAEIDADHAWGMSCAWNPSPFFGPIFACPCLCVDLGSGETFASGSTGTDAIGLNSFIGETGRVPAINRHRSVAYMAHPPNLEQSGLPRKMGASAGRFSAYEYANSSVLISRSTKHGFAD